MQLEYLNDDGIDILCCKTLSWTHNYVEFFVAVYLYFVMVVKFWLLWNCEGLRSHWFEL